MAKAAELKQQGVSDIICVSVNDPFVMAAWAKDQGTAGKIRLLADPSAALAKALDLTVDIAPLGGVSERQQPPIRANECVADSQQKVLHGGGRWEDHCFASGA